MQTVPYAAYPPPLDSSFPLLSLDMMDAAMPESTHIYRREPWGAGPWGEVAVGCGSDGGVRLSLGQFLVRFLVSLLHVSSGRRDDAIPDGMAEDSSNLISIQQTPFLLLRQ